MKIYEKYMKIYEKKEDVQKDREQLIWLTNQNSYILKFG